MFGHVPQRSFSGFRKDSCEQQVPLAAQHVYRLLLLLALSAEALTDVF